MTTLLPLRGRESRSYSPDKLLYYRPTPRPQPPFIPTLSYIPAPYTPTPPFKPTLSYILAPGVRPLIKKPMPEPPSRGWGSNVVWWKRKQKMAKGVKKHVVTKRKPVKPVTRKNVVMKRTCKRTAKKR